MDTRIINNSIAKSLGLPPTSFKFDIDQSFFNIYHDRVMFGLISLPVALKTVPSVGHVDNYLRLDMLLRCVKEKQEFGIPYIFALDADARVVVMERVSGNTVSAAFVDGGLQGIGLRSLANRCGRWLNWFHCLEAAPATLFPVASFLESLGEKIADTPLPGNSVVDKSFRLLMESAAIAGAESVPHGLLHGDFKPDNLVVSASRIVGIDFEIIPRGMLLSDLVQFMNHVRLLCYEPAALWSRLWREKTPLESAFLRGYEQDGFVVPQLPLDWLQVHHLCRMACDISQRNRGLRERYLAACVNRELIQLNRKLEATIFLQQG